MAITQDQKTALLGVTSFMFDYAPDQESFARFESIIDGNPSFYALGRSLEKTDAFNSQFSDDAVLADKIDVILGRLGLESDSAGYEKGVEFINARVDDGVDFGQVLIEIGEKMLADEQLPELAAASATLKNKIAVAEHYLESGIEGYSNENLPALLDGIDDTQGSVDQAKANIDNAVPGVEGDTFSLTAETDVATANTFEAGLDYNPGGTDRVNALQDEDVLTGEGANPTLNATLGNANDNGATIITPELNGIETINAEFTGSGNAAVTDLDLQDATGLNELNITRITQASNTAEVANIQNALESMSLANTNANQAGTVEFSYAAGALAGENTSSLSLDNVNVGTVNVGQNTSGVGASVGVNTQGYENLTINSTGAANTVGTFNLPMDTGSEGSITITGDQNLTLANNTQINGAVSGQREATLFNNGIAGNFGRLATIDASALEGALTLNIAAGMLSSGKADTSGVNQDVTITGSAQGDTFYLNDAVQAGDTIDGGEGEDNLVVYTGGVTTGTVTGVENVDVQLTGNVTMDMAQLADATAINVRNIDNVAGTSADTGNWTATLNNLTADQAAGLTVQHSTTQNNALGDTTVVANLADDTGADDSVAVEIQEGVNTDARFNFTLNTNAIENVTLTDSDTEDNTVQLQNVAALTDTLTLEGGQEDDFFNLDATANLYRYDLGDGATMNDGTGVVDVAAGAAERLVATTIDASTYVGDAVVRVADSAASNGAQAITMGTGDDTVIFDDLNDNTAGLTISDSVDGGEGNDVLALDGHGTNINISASEWTNVSNIETVHLVGNAQADNNALNTANAYNLTLTNDFISNNGEAVTGGRLINIVNDNDPANSVSTAATAGVGANTGVTIDARQLAADRNFSYDGEEGAARTADRFIMSDANVNGLAVIDGGANFVDGSNTTSSAANADVMEVRNASVVTIGDLAGVSNVGTLQFTNDQASTQTNQLVLDSATVDRLVNTTRNADAANTEALDIEARGNDLGANTVNTELDVDARQVNGNFALTIDTSQDQTGAATNAGNDTASMAVNLGGATQTINLGGQTATGADTVSFTGTSALATFAAGSVTFGTTATQQFNLTGVEVLDFSNYVDTATAAPGNNADTIVYGTAVAGVNTLTVANSSTDWTLTDTSNTLTTMIGGAGNDAITGGTAVVTMTGGAGNDVLNAAASTGAVTINGGAGNDTITAGAAGSTINGGAGADGITATNGQVDTFVYSAASDSTATAFDTITNFVTTEDVINLDALFAGGPAAPAAITTSAAALNGTAAEFAGNEVAFHDDGTDTTVYVDVSGDGAFGAGDMQIELTGTGLGLVAGDFIV